MDEDDAFQGARHIINIILRPLTVRVCYICDGYEILSLLSPPPHQMFLQYALMDNYNMCVENTITTQNGFFHLFFILRHRTLRIYTMYYISIIISINLCVV